MNSRFDMVCCCLSVWLLARLTASSCRIRSVGTLLPTATTSSLIKNL